MNYNISKYNFRSYNYGNNYSSESRPYKIINLVKLNTNYYESILSVCKRIKKMWSSFQK